MPVSCVEPLSALLSVPVLVEELCVGFSDIDGGLFGVEVSFCSEMNITESVIDVSVVLSIEVWHPMLSACSFSSVWQPIEDDEVSV